MCRLKSVVAFCVVVFLAGCAGGPQTQPPSLNLRRLNDQGSPLALAARTLEQIGDVRERTEIANLIADAYISQDAPGDAGLLLDYATGLAPFTAASAASIGEAARTAWLYAELGRTDDALTVLNGELERALTISDNRERGAALDAVIAAAFRVGEDAFELLGRAAESLFVLEDLGVRAQLLVSTALRYHGAGNRATMNALIQQAIPAAGSIPNPWQRAAAISELAAAYEALGNRDAALGAIDEAIEEIRRTGNGPAPQADTEYLLRVVDNVVRMAQTLSAVELVERLQQPQQRARGLSAVATGYGRQDARSAAYIFFSRAVREASLVDAPLDRVRAMVDVAHGYLLVGDADLAVIQANGASSVALQTADERERLEAGRQILQIYAAAGEIGRATLFLSDMGEGEVRERLTVAFAAALVQADRRADARTLLLQRFPGEPSGPGLPFAAEIAAVLAASGEVEPALRWAAASSRPAAAARVLAELGRRGVTADTLSDNEREALLALADHLAAL